ncbi:MAG: 2-oxo-4-hydroxy-4-carboxy-5-ureidoimidazoline decarboxylase [Bdellovibrionales bacterium]|nr:2-oxo-4-hydroxy-4-carboxy-5-ureidoimidazoline decarboxylase [Bdellovibrionales bacterium]
MTQAATIKYTLKQLNQLPDDEAREAFFACCGVKAWAASMSRSRPFQTMTAMVKTADEIWNRLSPEQKRDAFAHHPRIGEKTGGETEQSEQKGASNASDDVKAKLIQGNRDYETKFDHVFLICATGKSGEEMLEALQRRLSNDPETELQIAFKEQSKITRLRLEKFFK